MKYVKKILITAIVANCQLLISQPAPKPDPLLFESIEGSDHFYKVVNADAQDPETVLDAIKKIYGPQKDNSFVAFINRSDADGNTTTKYQRYYKERIVQGAVFITHANNLGKISYLVADFKNEVDDKAINYTAEKAIAIAVDKLPPDVVYKWQNPDYEQGLKDHTGDPNATYYPQTAALEYRYDPSSGLFAPVFVVNLPAVNELQGQVYCISAANGNLISSDYLIETCVPRTPELIKNAAAKKERTVAAQKTRSGICNNDCESGISTTQLYGSQNINFGEHFIINGGCTNHLRQDCNGQVIHTTHGSGLFTDYNSSGAFNNGSGDDRGVQTHWCLEKTVEFYHTKFSRNGMDGSNIDIDATNGGDAGNASFSPTDFKLQFGDATGFTFTDVNAIDVVGHEFTHGVSKFEIGGQTSGHTFASKSEPAALNESFSDILGTMIEYYTKSNYSTGSNFSYVLGADVFQHVSHSIGTSCNGITTFFADRSMDAPNNTDQPNTYQGNFWIDTTCHSTDDGGRHINGQVQNYWFYLLAEGGSGTNDNGDAYCVAGIGKESAMRIAFHNLSNHMLRGSVFMDARIGSILSAGTLFGSNSNEVAQVIAAWHAVGLGSNYGSSISLNNHAATGTESYSYVNPVELYNFNGQGGSTVTLVSNSYIGMSAGTSFDAGAYLSAYITSPCAGSARGANPDTYLPAAVAGNTVYNPIKSGKQAGEVLTCIVMPNPNNGNFTVSFNSEATGKLTLSNELGMPVYEKNSVNAKSVEIQLQGLTSGVYVLTFTSAAKEVKHVKLIIN